MPLERTTSDASESSEETERRVRAPRLDMQRFTLVLPRRAGDLWSSRRAHWRCIRVRRECDTGLLVL